MSTDALERAEATGYTPHGVPFEVLMDVARQIGQVAAELGATRYAEPPEVFDDENLAMEFTRQLLRGSGNAAALVALGIDPRLAADMANVMDRKTQ